MTLGIRDSRSRADLREVKGSALVDIVEVNVIGVEEDDEGERVREVKDDKYARRSRLSRLHDSVGKLERHRMT